MTCCTPSWFLHVQRRLTQAGPASRTQSSCGWPLANLPCRAVACAGSYSVGDKRQATTDDGAVRDDQDCAKHKFQVLERATGSRNHGDILCCEHSAKYCLCHWHLPIWRTCTRSRRTQEYQSKSAAVRFKVGQRRAGVSSHDQRFSGWRAANYAPELGRSCSVMCTHYCTHSG